MLVLFAVHVYAGVGYIDSAIGTAGDVADSVDPFVGLFYSAGVSSDSASDSSGCRC